MEYPCHVTLPWSAILTDREPQSTSWAGPGCGHYVSWSYQPPPPAEPQPHFPLLPLAGAPKTWAFISRAKYPRSLQSLSFLALRQSDNYLFSFPLLLASSEVFWLALVCMKYYQNIAHFLHPAASDTGNMESLGLWLAGARLSFPSENSCFVLKLRWEFWWKEEWVRNVYKGFVALFNMSAIISGQ